MELIVKPTLFNSVDQTIFSLQSSDGASGVALVHNHGALFLKALGSPQISDGLGLGLRLDEWTKLEVVFGATGVSTRTSVIGTQKKSEVFASLSSLLDALRDVDHICFAASWVGYPKDCFNGSIEAPRLYGGSQADPDSDRAVLASWCFTDSGNSEWVEDEIDRSRLLALINLPMRAVRSSAWSGRNMDWKTAPQEYAAIAFHSDDLGDCKWETTIAATVPADVPSGVYGLTIDNQIGADTIPFYVLPDTASPKQRIVFLAPTFTYMACQPCAR